ncbi:MULTISPECIES: polysaccharide deacetylase [unclassified Rhizobium]|uniref:polysaccharide deacetylase family protein n=1 Tax=unclassified Rhizobium TaxID=2613769 RepID=UPI0006F7EC29|nr:MULTISPECIES: polysaccharide deacetylase [unclassified Rhizobium]KQV39367.1 polysaccharide deacetylase [Rhizobium sp. Root1212]KRD35372.1 polysaccharide deacetylase [Rhizobium sp. Root268]
MTTVCLTFDFDAVSLWISSLKQTTANPMSRGEFGANVGLPRVLQLLSEKQVKATFFVPAHTAASFPAETLTILEAGHEIGVHGYCHETPIGLSRDEEASLLDRSQSKLRNSLGNDFQPVGYRSPAWDLSTNSVELLEERGFLYDSSLMADDYSPYWAQRGYEVSEEIFRPGPPSKVVEVPVAWELDDFPHFMFLNKPMYQGMRTPAEVFELWKGEFDFSSTIDRGVFTLTMHPQIIGRGPRIAMLSKLIDHMKATPGTSFSTVADAALAWRASATHPSVETNR